MATFKARLGEDLRRFQLPLNSLSWETLRHEITNRFGIDPTKQVRVKYIDSEGELVNLSSNEELREALNSLKGSSAIRLEVSLQTSTPTANPILTKAISSGSCSSCKNEITGVWFKCGHCSDFNLCQTCEKNSQSSHPPSHIFLMIKSPIKPTHPAWLAKAPLLPPLHSETPVLSPQPAPEPKKESPVQVLSSLSSRLVGDLSIPSETVLLPGKIFTKTWRIVNDGSQKWTTDTRLRFIEGEQLTKLTSTAVPLATPNQQVEISISLQAPHKPGRFTSVWQLASGQNYFGSQLKCDILVVEGEKESPRSSFEIEGESSESLVLPLPNDERYEEEMKQLLSQGFGNREKNFQLLKKHGGDLSLVLEALCADQEAGWISN